MTYSCPIKLDHGVTEYIITNVLRTSVTCPDGRYDVYDCAPRIPRGSTWMPQSRYNGWSSGVHSAPARSNGRLWEDIEPRTGMLLGNFPRHTHTWDWSTPP